MRIGSVMFEHCGGGLVVVHSDRGQQELRLTESELAAMALQAEAFALSDRRHAAQLAEIQRLDLWRASAREVIEKLKAEVAELKAKHVAFGEASRHG